MNNLQQLRHFVALAELGNFARAADAVHLTQPALSRSIQALEASLDCRLLDRHSRGISLTAHGQLVLEHAQHLLAGSQNLKNAVRQLGNLEAGELLLGSGPFPAARLVPSMLARLVNAYPKISVTLTIDNWWGLREKLLSDALELFIADVRDLQGDPLLQIDILGTYRGVFCCRPDHPLTGRSHVSLKDLLDYPLAATQLPRHITQTLATLSGREQPVNIHCDDIMVLKALVMESDVLTMVLRDVIAEDVAQGRLSILPVQEGPFEQASVYGLVSRAGHTLSPAARMFWQQVLADMQGRMGDI